MPNLNKIAKVMGLDEEAVQVLPKIKFTDNHQSPRGNELPSIFRMLHLSPQKTALVIPCG